MVDGVQLEETTETMADEAYDPEVTQQLILLQLMRLYDVQMSILSEMNDERAEVMQKKHDAGELFTDFPWVQ